MFKRELCYNSLSDHAFLYYFLVLVLYFISITYALFINRELFSSYTKEYTDKKRDIYIKGYGLSCHN